MYFLKRAKKLKQAPMSLVEAVCGFFKETGGVQKRLAFFTHKGSKDPAHTVQSPKSNEEGDCQKSVFVCNAE